MNNKRYFWINLPYACFGIISLDGMIIDTAPIAAWMKGKNLQDIKPWLKKKKAAVEEIKQP